MSATGSAPTSDRLTSANQIKTISAHIFNQRVIEDSYQDNFYKILLKDFDPHFFAHLHDIPLEVVPKAEVIFHFYDFFNHLCRNYDGSDVALCYANYYVEWANGSAN